MSNSIENHEKSIPNRPKWCLGASKIYKNGVQKRFGRALGSRAAPGCHFVAPSYAFLHVFGTTWVILGRFWGPLKIRGGAKSDPENSIRRLFGALWRPKGGKKRFWEAFGTSMKF